MYFDTLHSGGYCIENDFGVPRFLDPTGKTLMHYVATAEKFPIPEIESEFKAFSFLGKSRFGNTCSVKTKETSTFTIPSYLTDTNLMFFFLGGSDNAKNVNPGWFDHDMFMIDLLPSFTHWWWIRGEYNYVQCMTRGCQGNKMTISLKQNEPVLCDYEFMCSQTTFTEIPTLPSFTIVEGDCEVYTLRYATIDVIGENGSNLGTSGLRIEELVIVHDNKLEEFYGVANGEGIYATDRWSVDKREVMGTIKAVIEDMNFWNYCLNYDSGAERIKITLNLVKGNKVIKVFLEQVSPMSPKLIQEGVFKIEGDFGAFEDFTKPNKEGFMIHIESVNELNKVGDWPLYGSFADDTTPPDTSAATITVTPVGNVNQVGWLPATDALGPGESDNSAQSDLRYFLYRSSSNNLITDPATVRANGNLIANGFNLLSYDDAGLQAGTYYYNFICADLNGNEEIGAQQSGTIV